MAAAKKKEDTALILRTCAEDGGSHGGFVWPLKVGSVVTCPDWKPKAECGNGLHGLLWGAGDGGLLNWDASAKWLICEITLSKAVTLGGKCKFPECKILFVGDRKGATDYLLPRVTHKENVVGAFLQCGDSESIAGGYGATVSGGDSATVSGGYGAELRIKYYDNKADRYRTALAYVGEKSIKANTAYRLNDKHEFVEAKATGAQS